MHPQEYDAAMRAAIAEANLSEPEDDRPRPKVGAVLVDDAGKIVLRAHRNVQKDGGHAEYNLLEKAKNLIQPLDLPSCTLFVTLEPCTTRSPNKTPCALRIIEAGIQRVVIGWLDTNPDIVGRGETMLRTSDISVDRFPDTLVREIVAMNEDWELSNRRHHLPPTSRFVTHSIPDLLVSFLKDRDVKVSSLPTSADTALSDLAGLLPVGDQESALSFLQAALGNAYDLKYQDLQYLKEGSPVDARGKVPEWSVPIRAVFERYFDQKPVPPDARIVNVGCGNGAELRALFGLSADLTLVDLAPRSLQVASDGLSRVSSHVMDAATLSGLPSQTFDLYVSLRTYQSTYFDRRSAIRSAWRVLKPGGAVVISIASAFLDWRHELLPGLLISGTTKIDPHLPFEIADEVRRGMVGTGFTDIHIVTTDTELLVAGRRPRAISHA